MKNLKTHSVSLFKPKFSWLRWFYTLLYTLSIPLLLLRWLWRSQKNPGYRKRWLERFGFFKETPAAQGIWIHAVSVGEVVAASPLIQALQTEPQFSKNSKTPITVTTTTPTGSERLRQLFPNKNEIFHVYFPMDLPWILNAFLQKIKPKLCIILETEIWPNCLHALAQNNIPVVLVNARISDNSLKGYYRFRSWLKPMFNALSAVLAQSEQDAKRFQQLGMDSAKIHTIGNIKYDIPQNIQQIEIAHRLKSILNKDYIWVAASTHEGEEAIILKAHQKILQTFPNTLLILVPRHPERFQGVGELIKNQAFEFEHWSDWKNKVAHSTDLTKFNSTINSKKISVLLGDTLGDLPLFYNVAEMAFVGGSLVPKGGHNMLEAAQAGIPILTGPSISNFQDIYHSLKKAEALEVVQNDITLANALLALFQDPEKRLQNGQNALKVLEFHKGVVQKIIDFLKVFLKNK